MPIKNYTTSVRAEKTVLEIQAILARKAKSVSVEYDLGTPAAVTFSLQMGEELWFKLPANVPGVLATMHRDRVERRYRTESQARNVAWRIIKDWLDAQMAIIDAGQATAVEVFFPYLLQGQGETIYQKFENQQKQLTAGTGATL